jgi:hypothetical protein
MTEKFLLDYGTLLAKNSKATVTIINSNLKNQQNNYFEHAVDTLQSFHNIQITMLENRKLNEEFLEPFDLILVSEDFWNATCENLKPEVKNNFSYLIIHKHVTPSK